MRRMILPLMLFVSVACQPATVELTEEQTAAIADTVRQQADAFFDAFRAIDVDRGMAPFGSELVWAENGVLGANRDSLVTAWRGIFAAMRQVTSGDWGEVYIKVLGPDAAVFTGSFDWTGVDTTGAPMGATGVWTTVWVRTTEGWKVAHGHESYTPRVEPM